jgi:hypothetical protein
MSDVSSTIIQQVWRNTLRSSALRRYSALRRLDPPPSIVMIEPVV